ncbi:Cysteine desulfurase IscS [bioreactor metagenome]|uniref:cysteine desulfurase n=1 Tax=bioreactor metagenome TaxID=1076179 RepID=A0A645EEJ2_9ZZZZ
MGYDVIYLDIKNGGAIDPKELKSLMTPSTVIVSMMHVNNETGAINDVDAAYKQMRAVSQSALMHVDGSQSFLKLPNLPACDMYTLCAHKFHGPKGVGALYVKKGTHFSGGQTGGGQEGGLRSGTHNVPGIMGMDSAIEKYMASQQRYIERMRTCKLRLAGALLSINDTVVNGPDPKDGAPNILNISFLGVRGEVLLHALEERKVYVSTGSACSAKKQGNNRILTAMGITGERAEGAIRFSFSPFNTPSEMDEAAIHVRECVNTLRKFKRK